MLLLLNRLIAKLPRSKGEIIWYHPHWMWKLGIDPVPWWTVAWFLYFPDRIRRRTLARIKRMLKHQSVVIDHVLASHIDLGCDKDGIPF
jgi:hypothetical protein